MLLGYTVTPAVDLALRSARYLPEPLDRRFSKMTREAAWAAGRLRRVPRCGAGLVSGNGVPIQDVSDMVGTSRLMSPRLSTAT
jgi:hypothetical protein